ncbi:MAG: hypothetical protein ACK4VI_04540 [Alphaproteobacteria bacterium]
MRNSNNQPEMSQIRQAINTGLGLLTASNASAAATLLGMGEFNAAFTAASMAGAALLYATHVQKDDHKASGLKNYSMGFAVGAVLSVLAPPDLEANAQTLQSEGPAGHDFLMQSVEESNYPALIAVTFD